MKHTPAQSEALFTLINTLSPIKFIDSSYGNDLCDSISNEEAKMQIFLPNVTNVFGDLDSSEDILSFGIALRDLQDNNNTIDYDFTLLEVLSVLRALEWEFLCNGDRLLTGLEVLQSHSHLDWKKHILPFFQLGVGEDIFIEAWDVERTK